MRCRAFNFVALGSLAMCVAVLLLGWRSHTFVDEFAVVRSTRGPMSPKRELSVSYWPLHIQSDQGEVRVEIIIGGTVSGWSGGVDRAWSLAYFRESTAERTSVDRSATADTYSDAHIVFRRDAGVGAKPFGISVLSETLAFALAVPPLIWLCGRRRNGVTVGLNSIVRFTRSKLALRPLKIASIACCTAVTTLWIASYFTSICLRRFGTTDRSDSSHRIHVYRGTVDVERTLMSFPTPPSRPDILNWYVSFTAPPPTSIFMRPVTTYFDFAGVKHRSSGSTRIRTDLLTLPWWLLAVVSAIGPLWITASFLRRRRIRGPHACRRCGYDLRATPDRCPECGGIPANVMAVPK